MSVNNNADVTVYSHTSPTGRKYIGITSQTTARRWGKTGHGYNNHKVMSRVVRKYGFDNLEHSIVATGLSRRDACVLERMLIEAYKRTVGIYNETDGGDNHFSLSDAARKRLSDAHKGQRSWNKGLTGIYSAETIEKMAAAKRKADYFIACRVCDTKVKTYPYYNRAYCSRACYLHKLRGTTPVLEAMA